MTPAFVALGSGRGDSPGYIREGLSALSRLGSQFTNSDLYKTGPLGDAEQPHSYHAVARLETIVSPREFLKQLHAIEQHYDRMREHRHEPHTLDLDLLTYDDMQSDDPGCLLPHPQLRRRPFVLLPLREIDPATRIPPDGTNIDALIAALPPADLADVARIPQTARLQRPPSLDYDAPAGAATRYDELRPLSQFDRIVFEKVAEMIALQPGLRIVDVGCGTGRFSELLAQRGARVTGLDASQSMLAAARAGARRGKGDLQYIQGDANAWMPPGPFDAATFFFSLQYMSLAAPFWEALLAALRSGGSVAFVTFPHRHFTETWLRRFFPGIPRIDLARFPSVPALVDCMAGHGLQSIVVQEILHESVSAAPELIARVERKYLSTFHLMTAQEFAAGLAAMKSAFDGQATLKRWIRAVVVVGAKARPV